MPFETVSEKVVQERRIQVCMRCRREISGADRNKFHTAGSLGGSLAGSLGASMALGAVLGPVGLIGGAIAGSLAGAKAGVKVSDKACEMAEKNADSYCPECKKIMSSDNNSNEKNNLWDSFGNKGNRKESNEKKSMWDSFGSKGNRLGGK